MSVRQNNNLSGAWMFVALIVSLVAAWARPVPAQETGTPTAQSDSAMVERGVEIVEQRFCRACHVIGSEGMTVGPDLNQVTVRRDADWLRRWLASPPTMKPGTLMPIYPWTEDELDAIIVYLGQFRTPVEGAAILAEHGTGMEGGLALVEAYQCWACHAVNDQLGRPIYPDLATLKERRTPEWETDWLADPQALIPGTFMPNFQLSGDEIQAITEYLYR